MCGAPNATREQAQASAQAALLAARDAGEAPPLPVDGPMGGPPGGEVRIQIGNAAHRGFAVADGNDIYAALFKSQRHHLLDVCIVVGDEYPGHGNPFAARPHGDTPTLFTII